MTYFLRLEVTHAKGRILLTQTKHTKGLSDLAHLPDSKPVNTPVEVNVKYHKSYEGNSDPIVGNWLYSLIDAPVLTSTLVYSLYITTSTDCFFWYQLGQLSWNLLLRHWLVVYVSWRFYYFMEVEETRSGIKIFYGGWEMHNVFLLAPKPSGFLKFFIKLASSLWLPFPFMLIILCDSNFTLSSLSGAYKTYWGWLSFYLGKVTRQISTPSSSAL